MDLQVRGRVYLVTGGSRRLGFAAAEVLVAEGARVVLTGTHEASAADAAARLTRDADTHDRVAWLVADNADADTPDRLIAAAEERFGRLDGALVSVGGTPPGTFASTSDEVWRGAFESVFLGVVRLARVLGLCLGADTARTAPDPFVAGTGSSLVVVLASSVRVPLARLPVSNGLFPGLAASSRCSPRNSGRPERASMASCREDRHRPRARVRRS